jgi:predicted Zn-ribbon and HTH transcriptional regulator
MRYIRKFNESEIWNGSKSHYNTLKAVPNKVIDEVNLKFYKCNDCFFEFGTVEDKQLYCNVCGSENIENTLQ